MNLPLDLAHIAPQLKQVLYEHYEPYAKTAGKGYLAKKGGDPQVSCPEDVLRLLAPEWEQYKECMQRHNRGLKLAS